ncbi:MAG: hypothetical protein WC854_09780 [Bacteroidales bacterium]
MSSAFFIYRYLTGIYFIDHIAIDAKADGSFYMDVFTAGTGKAKTVKAQLQTLDGKSFGSPLSAEITENEGKATIKESFTNPALWNPEFPNRYQVVVSINDGGKVIHQDKWHKYKALSGI